MSEDDDARTRKVAIEAVGYRLPDDVIEYALGTHAHEKTEDLVERLAAMTAESKKDGRRRRALAGDINDLKIVLAVRGADPSVGILDEIEINRHRWPTREAPTLTVSLDCLARVLAEAFPSIDPADLARLMASLCLRGAIGDPSLATREANRYVPEDDDHDDAL